MESVFIHEQEYRIERLIGHGKGGYSYLASKNGILVVVKQIHHEPCEYYRFGNKIEAELRDYQRLRQAGIRVPVMLDYDVRAERIVKEYIEGDTIFHLVKNGKSVDKYLPQVRAMAGQAGAAGLNIDYFPTNFVVRDGLLWYIDYECNEYMDEWNFENWGIKYWSMTPEFKEYLHGTMNYKPLIPEYDAAVADLIRTNLKAHHLDIPGTVYFDEGLDHLSDFYSQPSRAYYVLVKDETVIGGIGLAEFSGFSDCCELQKLYLREDAKGSGLGYELISFIEEKAREMGYKQIYLETHTNLQAAIHIYEKSGYREIERPAANAIKIDTYVRVDAI